MVVDHHIIVEYCDIKKNQMVVDHQIIVPADNGRIKQSKYLCIKLKI